MNRQSKYKEGEIVKNALNLLDAGTPMVVFDLETTGLGKVTDRILSCSAIKVVKENGVFSEKDRLNLFMNPGFPIPQSASNVNHITDDMVKDCPRENDGACVIRRFFGERPLVCGYNSISFDEPFVNAMYNRVFGEEFRPILHLDVYRLAKEKLLNLKKHTLEYVSRELGADVGLEFHNSIDDVIATLRTLNILLDSYKEPEPNVVKQRLYVKNVSLFNPSHVVNRLYVWTEPYGKTYYDIYKKMWDSTLEHVDYDALEQDILRKNGASSLGEVIKKLKSEAN